MSIFTKWNESVDSKQLVDEVKKAAENSAEYKEVPLGEYVVEVEKMELKESKKGDPMLSVQFRIKDGEFEKSCLFLNQIIVQGFQIHIANEFLRSLDSGIVVDFDGNYEDYNNTILDIHEAIDKKVEYLIEYGEKKGYKTFRILEVYDA